MEVFLKRIKYDKIQAQKGTEAGKSAKPAMTSRLLEWQSWQEKCTKRVFRILRQKL